jgi:hypothetical protein
MSRGVNGRHLADESLPRGACRLAARLSLPTRRRGEREKGDSEEEENLFHFIHYCC